MSAQELCITCQRPLTPDEIAVTKKLINRGAAKFLCVSCLAKHFQVTEKDVYQKIEEFREMGCTLFSPKI